MTSVPAGSGDPRRFTVAVTPDDPSSATFTARVTVAAGQVLVTELSLRAGAGGGDLPAELADLDFASLVRTAVALSEGVTRSPSAEMPPESPAPPPRRRPAREPGVTGVPSDLALVYWRLGSVAKVADHYDVKSHVARGWIKTLRSGGELPDPWTRRRKA